MHSATKLGFCVCIHTLRLILRHDIFIFPLKRENTIFFILKKPEKSMWKKMNDLFDKWFHFIPASMTLNL